MAFLMFIPISYQKINIGDTVINIRDIKDSYYIIPSGHEFTVIEYDEKYSRFICEDLSKLKLRSWARLYSEGLSRSGAGLRSLDW